MPSQSPVINADLRATVLAMHLAQRFQKHLPEFSHMLVIEAKLVLERFPRNELHGERVAQGMGETAMRSMPACPAKRVTAACTLRSANGVPRLLRNTTV